MTHKRDYAYEALAEVTGTDLEVGRGQLNAALRDIRAQHPSLASTEDSYLLGAEVHDRAKMYRRVFPDVVLTPTALAKHWLRVEAESTKVSGVNLHADKPEPERPVSSRERNLAEARKILAMFDKGGSDVRKEV
jgi:hypothetical protein